MYFICQSSSTHSLTPQPGNLPDHRIKPPHQLPPHLLRHHHIPAILPRFPHETIIVRQIIPIQSKTISFSFQNFPHLIVPAHDNLVFVVVADTGEEGDMVELCLLVGGGVDGGG